MRHTWHRRVAVVASAALTSVGLVLGTPAQATQSTMNINGKSIVVDNISSASAGRVAGLVGNADNVTSSDGFGPAAGLMQAGDRIIVTNKYLAWLDNTLTGGDPWAGGLMAGLWYLQGSGENLNFRNDGAWNELLPYHYNNGTGHSLIANRHPQCGDLPGYQYYAERDPTPATSRNGVASAVYGGGVSYEYTGNFTNTSGSRDVDPNKGGTQTLRYRVRYDFGPDADAIRVETQVDRASGHGSSPISVLFGGVYNAASEWVAGYAPNVDRSNRVGNANVTRRGFGGVSGQPDKAAGVEADIPNDLGLGISYWKNPNDGDPPGTDWYMKDHEFSPNQYPDRILRVTTVSGPSGDVTQFPLAMHIYTPAVKAYSLEFDAVHSCAGGTPLPLGWNFSWTHDLNTRAPGPAACGDGLDNDGDGLTDMSDPGCSSSSDNDEFNAPPPVAACADGSDNDIDGLTDLADPGCSNSGDTDERNSPHFTDRLGPGDQLNPGEMLRSPDGRWCLVMEPDGNLVGYRCGVGEVWFQTSTSGQGATVAKMESDGHFVMYRQSNFGVTWDRPHSGYVANSRLVLQNDRNIVIYPTVTWSCNAETETPTARCTIV